MPTIFFTVLLSIVNSFRIFKESYLFFGTNYPPDHSYTLQYYMNNNFLKLDYQSLASAAVLTSVLVFLIVMGGLRCRGGIVSETPECCAFYGAGCDIPAACRGYRRVVVFRGRSGFAPGAGATLLFDVSCSIRSSGTASFTP